MAEEGEGEGRGGRRRYRRKGEHGGGRKTGVGLKLGMLLGIVRTRMRPHTVDRRACRLPTVPLPVMLPKDPGCGPGRAL